MRLGPSGTPVLGRSSTLWVLLFSFVNQEEGLSLVNDSEHLWRSPFLSVMAKVKIMEGSQKWGN